MKNIVLAIICLVFLTNCGGKKNDQHDQQSASIDIKLDELSSDKDPTCGMTLVEGAIADTMTIDGKLYGFCNASCKDGQKHEKHKHEGHDSHSHDHK